MLETQSAVKLIAAENERTMTCRDFERTWNELIDAEGSAVATRRATGAEPGSTVTETASAGCGSMPRRVPTCRQVAVRYQALRRAIWTWGPPPGPSVELAERIMAEIGSPTPSAWAGRAPVKRRTEVADHRGSSVGSGRHQLLSAGSGSSDRQGRGQTALPDRRSCKRRRQSPRRRDECWRLPVISTMRLAEATAATWDLARTASEPAARISRQMLDAATGSDQKPDRDGVGHQFRAGCGNGLGSVARFADA